MPKTEAPLFPIKTDTRLAPKLAMDAVFELIVVTYRKKRTPAILIGQGERPKVATFGQICLARVATAATPNEKPTGDSNFAFLYSRLVAIGKGLRFVQRKGRSKRLIANRQLEGLINYTDILTILVCTCYHT